MTAFYDDSGQFSPGGGNFACFGMWVVPAPYIRECNDAWWEMLNMHFKFLGSLQIHGIEAKSSDLNDMLKKLKRKSTKLNKIQRRMYDHNLNTETKVSNLIKSIIDFVAKPPVSVKYLAVVFNKSETWQEFYVEKYNRWKILGQSKQTDRKILEKLRAELESSLVKSAYEYLLQRLQHLSKDPDFDFSDAFVVGDQSSCVRVMLETQAEIQAGLGKFSDLPTILNRSWWGSSLHDACLQMADWIAFAVRRWAEGDSSLLKQLLPNFRGYPDPNKLVGRGIVLCPNKECFPKLPLEEISF